MNNVIPQQNLAPVPQPIITSSAPVTKKSSVLVKIIIFIVIIILIALSFVGGYFIKSNQAAVKPAQLTISEPLTFSNINLWDTSKSYNYKIDGESLTLTPKDRIYQFQSNLVTFNSYSGDFEARVTVNQITPSTDSGRVTAELAYGSWYDYSHVHINVYIKNGSLFTESNSRIGNKWDDAEGGNFLVKETLPVDLIIQKKGNNIKTFIKTSTVDLIPVGNYTNFPSSDGAKFEVYSFAPDSDVTNADYTTQFSNLNIKPFENQLSTTSFDVCDYKYSDSFESLNTDKWHINSSKGIVTAKNGSFNITGAEDGKDQSDGANINSPITNTQFSAAIQLQSISSNGDATAEFVLDNPKATARLTLFKENNSYRLEAVGNVKDNSIASQSNLVNLTNPQVEGIYFKFTRSGTGVKALYSVDNGASYSQLGDFELGNSDPYYLLVYSVNKDGSPQTVSFDNLVVQCT